MLAFIICCALLHVCLRPSGQILRSSLPCSNDQWTTYSYCCSVKNTSLTIDITIYHPSHKQKWCQTSIDITAYKGHTDGELKKKTIPHLCRMSNNGCSVLLPLSHPRMGPPSTSIQSFLHPASFPVVFASTSVLSTPTYVVAWRASGRCPRVGRGSHSTSLLAGSLWFLWQCPANFFLLAAIFSLNLGRFLYRCLLVTFWLVFKAACHSAF